MTDYERPTVEFMTPRNRQEAVHLAGFITSLLVPRYEPTPAYPECLDGVFGQQPYTTPVRYSGIIMDNDAAPVDSEDEYSVEQHHQKLQEGFTYTGWHCQFTYTDSMTNTFYSPVYFNPTTEEYATWEM